MSNVKFKLNLRGLNELMKSREMQGVLTDAARQVAAAAGTGYEAEPTHNLSFAAITSVRAGTAAARRDNSENNTLLKAAGRVQV